MKKSVPVEENRFGQTGASSARKAKSIASPPKLPRSRRTKTRQPAALLEEHFAETELQAVVFAYFNPRAREVFLAGSFNDWQPRTTPMCKIGGDKWCTELMLLPGRYEYRFVVDGQWQDDPMAARFVANDFGGLNGIVEVEPMKSSPGSPP